MASLALIFLKYAAGAAGATFGFLIMYAIWGRCERWIEMRAERRHLHERESGVWNRIKQKTQEEIEWAQKNNEAVWTAQQQETAEKELPSCQNCERGTHDYSCADDCHAGSTDDDDAQWKNAAWFFEDDSKFEENEENRMVPFCIDEETDQETFRQNRIKICMDWIVSRIKSARLNGSADLRDWYNDPQRRDSFPIHAICRIFTGISRHDGHSQGFIRILLSSRDEVESCYQHYNDPEDGMKGGSHILLTYHATLREFADQMVHHLSRTKHKIFCDISQEFLKTADAPLSSKIQTQYNQKV